MSAFCILLWIAMGDASFHAAKGRPREFDMDEAADELPDDVHARDLAVLLSALVQASRYRRASE
ncbi:MAG TPA: hypothetical protein VF447_15135 [Terriglobales bacterium]